MKKSRRRRSAEIWTADALAGITAVRSNSGASPRNNVPAGEGAGGPYYVNVATIGT